MKKLIKLSFLLVSGIYFYSCVTEIPPVDVPTQLVVSVADDQDQLLSGVPVYLFDNETDFSDAKTTGNIEKRIKVGVTTENDSSSLTFDNLNYNSPYFLYISYRDRVRFTDLNNFNDDFSIPKGFLSSATTSSVKVNLQQAKSVVSFYTQLSSTDQFPITVFIGDDSVGVLSANRSGIPTPSNDNDALAYKLSTADKWYAKSSKGCLWAGDISVDGTESYEPISLEDCNAGAITFWTSSLNENLLPINVSLNGVDNIGEVEKTGEATECFSGNGLSVGRKAGVYQYTASSSKNSCNWTGTITVTEGGCELIELSTCDE